MVSQTAGGAVSIPAEHAAELSARFLPVVSLIMIPFLALGTIRRHPPESPG
ncbi:MAG: hypothetical protein H0W83_04615 [Planctomycetes bacterium]|nr:hypothetical protein [Planctomycetota bacterium]